MIGLAYPEISPIALSLGPIAIRWYSLAYLGGILLGWYLAVKNNKKYPPFLHINIIISIFDGFLDIV